jgi:hypothetical protein
MEWSINLKSTRLDFYVEIAVIGDLMKHALKVIVAERNKKRY